jgi:hypothetical protein
LQDGLRGRTVHATTLWLTFLRKVSQRSPCRGCRSVRTANGVVCVPWATVVSRILLVVAQTRPLSSSGFASATHVEMCAAVVCRIARTQRAEERRTEQLERRYLDAAALLQVPSCPSLLLLCLPRGLDCRVKWIERARGHCAT